MAVRGVFLRFLRPGTGNHTLRDASGTVLAGGQSTLPARSRFAKFIHQLKDVATDFKLPDRFDSDVGFGSLEITSDQPLSIVGLRLTVNQRSETVLITTPIAHPIECKVELRDVLLE